MRTIASKCMLGLLMLAMISSNLGCFMKMGGVIPNSKFAYPNSNVETLGAVSGESSRWRFLVARSVDQEMIDEAMTNALKAKGGDLLVNGKMTSEVFFPVLPIFKTTLTVSGTAAKMTVGRQELK